MGAVNFSHANADYLQGFSHPEIFDRSFLGVWYPPFRDKVIIVKQRCIDRGFFYRTTFGYRSIALQRELRLAYLRGGPLAAPAGESAHNFAMAEDSVLDSDPAAAGIQPDWRDDSYKVLGEEAKKEGLVWGGDWVKRDPGHIQWPGYVTGTELSVLLARWNKSGYVDDFSKLEYDIFPYIGAIK